MNKKAVVGMSIVDLWSTILLVVIILGFWILFALTGLFDSESARLLNAKVEVDANQMLLGYLRHDVNGMSMAEFILLNIDNIDMIKEESIKILEKTCTVEKDCYWEIEILRKGEFENINLKGSGETGYRFNGKAEFLLPSKDERIVVRMIRYSYPKILGEGHGPVYG